ncbi:replicative DNA helicase [Oceanicaulis sp.]|uniref:replicative DNA helicase n=1 Tax=Oceanicaulis sp. TaxID=1924941 RepID=UPI003D269F58
MLDQDYTPAPPVDEDSYAPPHNIEAEQAILGALLMENEIYWAVCPFLTAEDFYDPLHGRIYAECARVIGTGALADAVMLKDKFTTDPAMAQVGGAVYLADLMRDAPYGPSAREYGRLVHDLAKRRAMIAAGEALIVSARRPEDDQSADDVLEAHEGAIFALAENTPAERKGPVSFMDSVRAQLERVEASVKSGRGLAGLSTGLRALDAKLGGLCASDLIILAGRPSMGKTALATNIGFHLARRFEAETDENGEERVKSGGRGLFFSLEMGKEQLAGRILGEVTGIGTHDQRQGKLDMRQLQAMHEAARMIESVPLAIDDTGGLAIHALCARARRHKRMHGLDFVIVDYLQLVTCSGYAGQRVQEVSAITQALKALAKELNVPVIALSQLSRQVEQREDKKPQLSDLRESGSIEQDADVVMFCYREAYYLDRMEPKFGTPEHADWESAMAECRHQADIIIGKQRHGPIGSVKVAFDADTTKFSDQEGRL